MLKKYKKWLHGTSVINPANETSFRFDTKRPRGGLNVRSSVD